MALLSETYQFVPLLIAESSAGTVGSNYVKVNNAQWVTFLLAWGDADTAVVVTVEASSANSSNASETTLAFTYRLSGAASAGSDTWTASTTAATTGFSLTATTDTGKLAMIEIDPSEITEGQNYLRVVTTTTSFNSPTPATAIVAVLRPRYPQIEHVSST